jgi:hypothetical protein
LDFRQKRNLGEISRGKNCAGEINQDLFCADSEEVPLLRRESSRRKAKEQSQAKREAQADLLLDEDDPTLNNPALDLEDSDVDDEWTPLKEKEAGGGSGGVGAGGVGGGGRRKRGEDSSDEEYDELAAELARKRKRSCPDLEKVRCLSFLFKY